MEIFKEKEDCRGPESKLDKTNLILIIDVFHPGENTGTVTHFRRVVCPFVENGEECKINGKPCVKLNMSNKVYRPSEK